eukprot:m.132902 g.132902  ORF g.132902 m.132902 type:complete len:302 (+) comp9494_c0_seq4:1684-2589(+)
MGRQPCCDDVIQDDGQGGKRCQLRGLSSAGAAQTGAKAFELDARLAEESAQRIMLRHRGLSPAIEGCDRHDGRTDPRVLRDHAARAEQLAVGHEQTHQSFKIFQSDLLEQHRVQPEQQRQIALLGLGQLLGAGRVRGAARGVAARGGRLVELPHVLGLRFGCSFGQGCRASCLCLHNAQRLCAALLKDADESIARRENGVADSECAEVVVHHVQWVSVRCHSKAVVRMAVARADGGGTLIVLGGWAGAGACALLVAVAGQVAQREQGVLQDEQSAQPSPRAAGRRANPDRRQCHARIRSWC